MKPEMRVQSVDPAATDLAESSNEITKKGSLYFRIVRLIFLIFSKLYFRIEFLHFENVPKTSAFIVAPNHQSYLDPFWVSLPFRFPLRYMTWDRFINMPLVGHFIRSVGAFPVKLDTGDRAALRLAVEHLQRGGSLMIFPEGGRTKSGKVMTFKPGVIRLALDAKVPIVPVTIVGAYEAYNPHHLLPRPRKVRVFFHPPIAIATPDSKDELKTLLSDQTARLQAIVESGFDSR